MMIGLIYIRQSKESKLLESPEAQEAVARTLIPKDAQVTVYTDLSVSGDLAPQDRPAFSKLLARVQSNDQAMEPLYVAAYKQDRLGRNSLDNEWIYEYLAPRKSWVTLITGDEGKLEFTAAGHRRWSQGGSTATYQRENQVELMTDITHRKNRNGIPTGPAPFGYRYAGKRALEPDSDTAPILHHIFEDYASGLFSTRALADRLMRDKVPGTGYKGKEKHWRADTIAGMLCNPAYIGKTYAESRREKTGELVPATWPPLIEPDLWLRVEARRKAKTTSAGGGARKREYAFRGLLFHEECQRWFHGATDHRYTYYRCGSSTLPEDERCEMGKHAIREADLLPWVDRLMEGWAMNKAFAAKLMGKRVDSKAQAVEAAAKFERQITRIGVRFQAEEIDEATYHAELNKLRALRDHYAADAAPDPKPAELTTLADQWKHGDAAQRRAVLSALFEKLYVVDGKIHNAQPRVDRAQQARLLVDVSFTDPDWVEDEDFTEAGAMDGPGALNISKLRSGRDLNPRGPCGPTAFPVPRPRPS